MRPSDRRAAPGIVLILFICVLLMADRAFGATPTVAVEPCALLTLEEVGAVLHGTATQGRPHVVKINKVPVGGDCSYRSAENRLVVINLMVDAHPGGHQPKAFETGRRRPHVTDLSGLGDRAYTVTNPNGPPTVTFLRGKILVTIHVQGLDIDAAKQLASLVATRLPDSTGKVPAPVDRSTSSPTPQPRSVPPPPPSSSVLPSPPAGQGTGKLDPALVGSWLMKRPQDRSPFAHLFVQPHGTYSMMVGSKLQGGTIEGSNGVLRLTPKRGGNQESIRYRLVGNDRMEWTDQQGTVVVLNRKR